MTLFGVVSLYLGVFCHDVIRGLCVKSIGESFSTGSAAGYFRRW